MRNLNIVNGRWPRPTRSWRNKTGPLLLNLTAIATSTNTGDSSTSATIPRPTSITRFTADDPYARAAEVSSRWAVAERPESAVRTLSTDSDLNMVNSSRLTTTRS